MYRSESSERLLPSTSQEQHRQDYQSIGETEIETETVPVAQCLYLIT